MSKSDEMLCPRCGATCAFVINGWWCQACNWDDIVPHVGGPGDTAPVLKCKTCGRCDDEGVWVLRCKSCEKECREVQRDFGIGPYEYWGIPGNDVRLEWVSNCCDGDVERKLVSNCCEADVARC